MRLKNVIAVSTALTSLSAVPVAAQDQQQELPENAQDEEDEIEGDVIVVTGFRAALRVALEEKRTADRVQEVIAAEDLGQLPEASIAEALARLPGVATNRDRGNGTEITIRGLGPNLVNTLLNGREIVSAEQSRNIRYEQFPAELLNGAFVYKSPTAAQVEGAVAGQVDLRTVKPLEYTGSRFAINLRGTHNTESDHVRGADAYGYIASISYVGRISDTLGFAVGYSGRKQAVATTRTNIFRFTDSFADFDGNGTGQNGVVIGEADGFAGDGIPFGFEALARGGNDERQGAVAAVQWQPNANLEINGDFFYSHVSFDETQRGFRVENLPFGNVLSDATVNNGFVTAITTTNAGTDFGQVVRGVNEQFFFKDDLYAGGLNLAYQAGDWRIEVDGGYSTTHRDQQFLTLRTEPFGVIPTTRFQGNPGSPAGIAIDADLTDPNVFRVADFQIPENGGGAPLINDELVSGMIDLSREFDSFISRVRVGGRYVDRTKDFTQRTQFGFIDPAARIPIPASLLQDPFVFEGVFINIPSVSALNIADAVEQFFGPIAPTESQFDERSGYDINERTYAGYVQADLGGELFGMNVSGNIGVRVIRTENTSRSTRLEQTEQPDFSVITTSVPIVVENNFTDVLPNLNLNFELTDTLQLRLGASRAIARAPLDDLNPGVGVFTFGTPSAFGGNPFLEPFRANQLDASLEWYFGPDSALTIAGFYKDLDTFIVTQVTPITVADPAGGPDLEGTFRQPINGQGGSIRGFEILFQQAFTFLPSPLDGFGVYANYSYTDSSINVTENDNRIGTIPLPGLSKNVFNLVGYYSKNGLEARLGYRYRDSYATELGDTDRILFTAPEGVLDMQLSYTFPERSGIEGLELLFQANNITNEPFETFYGDRALQGRFEKFGTRLLFGAGYKF